MNFTGRKPTKQELLDDYARHEPQELLQLNGKVVGYGKGVEEVL